MSHLTYTIAPLPGTTTSAALAESAGTEALGRDILFDGDFHVTAKGDYVALQGLAALKQAIYHRLITRPGDFAYRPEYGAGVLQSVKKRLRSTELSELKSRIISQLSLEDRIEEVVRVTVTRQVGGISIDLKIKARGEVVSFSSINFTEDSFITGGITI